MTDEIRDRLRKVYELVNRGSTEGEKQAAKLALDRLMKKYNLSEEALNDVTRKVHRFKYATYLEERLIARLLTVMLNQKDLSNAVKDTWQKREIHIKLEYIDYVTLECAYEYFRRHMKEQWNKICAPEVARCRKAKTRSAKRQELQPIFFTKYCIASKLYKENELETRNTDNMSQAELKARNLVSGVQGGQYNRQVVTAHQLPEAKKPVTTGGQFQLFGS
ncbi:MAG: DUF2786 domain-containing protein [Imperialibacter sp.]|uniref:DUF2786 domain-containing protein n=1 Tax=Imperialibacter sp. TaxID=2038411 RepID=UPI0032F08985